jgi:sigma-B regulation protein RsbU (phosphoserine phosphatase)
MTPPLVNPKPESPAKVTALPDAETIIRQAFPGIDDSDVNAFLRASVMLTYPPDHVLCHEGEIEHIFYILAEGQAAITQKLGMGEKRLIATRAPGEFFGEMALIEKKPRTATITALTTIRVLEVTEDAFQDLLSNHPNLAMAMIRRFVSNVRASGQATITDLTRKNEELRKAYDDLKAAQVELVQKERLEHELEVAGELQRSLLPSKFPKVAGYTFAGRNVPARHVGGDLYDVIKVDDEHMGLLMADVSDKSVHAALFMAVTRTLFLAHARRSLSPNEVAHAVHDGIMEVSSNDDMFVTAFYGVLHLKTGRLRYVRAGQDKALLFRGDAPPTALEAEGRFLGMLPNLKLEERTIDLLPGDLLLAYSDGVPDAVTVTDESYGVERLVALVSRHRRASAEDVCAAIFNDVFAFRGPAAAFDDITVLVTRYDGNK